MKEENYKKPNKNIHIELGRKIEDRFGALMLLDKWEKEAGNIIEESRTLEKKKRGRPKKEIPGSKKITLWLPNDYQEYFKNLELNDRRKKRRVEGYGTKFKKILDHYQVWEKREREQVKTLQRYIGIMDEELKKYLGKFKKSGLDDELEGIISLLKESFKNFELVAGILKIEIAELKDILPKRDWEIFDLAYTVVKNINSHKINSH